MEISSIEDLIKYHMERQGEYERKQEIPDNCDCVDNWVTEQLKFHAQALVVLNRAKEETREYRVFTNITHLQESYTKLVKGNKLTKLSLCDLAVPFRDAHSFTDLEALSIIRGQVPMAKAIKMVINKEKQA